MQRALEQIGENTTADISPIIGIIYVFHKVPEQLIIGDLKNNNHSSSEKDSDRTKWNGKNSRADHLSWGGRRGQYSRGGWVQDDMIEVAKLATNS